MIGVHKSFLLRQLRRNGLPLVHLRSITGTRNTQKISQKKPQQPEQKPAPQEKSWLTRKVQTSPAAKAVFLRLTKLLGYGSPKQLAGLRSFALYQYVCAVKPDDDRLFWQQDCHLPPTFQSWFTITNLHIWLLTVRLRALPEGVHYTQALIDHLFLDVEDRIRAVLQPRASPPDPYTFHTSFYVNPNVLDPNASKTSRLTNRAPDRLVTRQMKIFKEQWAGLGMSFDLGLVKGDMELAGAVWRNLLGARGAQGITFPDSTTPRKFRRSVNFVGGEVVNVAKIDVETEESRDDGSGVHDFAPEDADLYLAYPKLMLDIVKYVRRELVRLEKLSDQDIMNGPFDKIKFGRVRQ